MPKGKNTCSPGGKKGDSKMASKTGRNYDEMVSRHPAKARSGSRPAQQAKRK
jgi:hypothetical protein